jgi:hypothetical protein
MGARHRAQDALRHVLIVLCLYLVALWLAFLKSKVVRPTFRCRNGASPNQWVAPWGNIAIHGTSDINGAPGPAWLKATDPDREFGVVRIDNDGYRFNGPPGARIGGRA